MILRNTITINDYAFEYMTGSEDKTPLLFLHGALADCRMWEQMISELPANLTGIAFTQRYFGLEKIYREEAPFGISTHSSDLQAFIKYVSAGKKVHLVAWSYAGHIALDVITKMPELFASAYIYENGVPTYITEEKLLNKFGNDAQAMFGPLFALPVEERSSEEAVRILIDGSGGISGYFDKLDSDSQKIILENSHTLPLQLVQTPPPKITAEMLAGVSIPVCFARGENTRPLFRIATDEAAKLVPGSKLQIVAGANHMLPMENPSLFLKNVTDFISGI